MPFIHMTTSATLALLPKTGFSLCNLNELLFKYKLAPLAGEITCGGLSGVSLVEQDVAFADIHSNFWKSEDLYKNYGHINYRVNYQNDASFIKTIENLCQYKLSGLSEILVLALRDKQMNQFPQLTDEQKQNLINQLTITVNNVIRHFLLNYVVARYLRIKKVSFILDDETLGYVTRKMYLSIPINFLSLSEEERLTLLNSLPELPNNLAIKDILQEEKPGHKIKDDELFLYLALKKLDHIYISQWLFGDYGPLIRSYKPDLEYAQQLITRAIDDIKAKLSLLISIINNDNFGERFHTNVLIQKAFPVAFIVDNPELLTNLKNEFRSNRSLKLGVDINLIVTDTEHLVQLKTYVDFYKLNLTIKTFSELGIEVSKNNNATPNQYILNY